METDNALSFATSNPTITNAASLLLQNRARTIQLQQNLTDGIIAATMCAIALSTYPSCGHRRRNFSPSQPCASYSPFHNRCNGAVSLFHAPTSDSPALRARCASRIEANIVRERDLIIVELEKSIEELSHRFWLGRKCPFDYVALIFERARLREALKGLWEVKEEELGELRDMQGIGALGLAW